MRGWARMDTWISERPRAAVAALVEASWVRKGAGAGETLGESTEDYVVNPRTVELRSLMEDGSPNRAVRVSRQFGKGDRLRFTHRNPLSPQTRFSQTCGEKFGHIFPSTVKTLK